MQLAGELCRICSGRILMQMDGTWCARCSTVFHQGCIERQGRVCPHCKEEFDAPENHFVYSRFCPECMTPNQPHKATCAACGTSSCWDNRGKYDEFVEHMKDTSRVYFVRGVTEFGLGVVCVFAIVVMLAVGLMRFSVLFFLILGVVVLIPRGVRTLRSSRRIAKFE